jgi:hypothetical protein
MNKYTYTHTYKYIPPQIHTYMHNSYIHILVNIHIQKYKYIWTFLKFAFLVPVQQIARADINQPWMLTESNRIQEVFEHYIHMCVCVCVCVCVYIYMYVYICMYIYIYIYIYIYVYVYVYIYIVWVGGSTCHLCSVCLSLCPPLSYESVEALVPCCARTLSKCIWCSCEQLCTYNTVKAVADSIYIYIYTTYT